MATFFGGFIIAFIEGWLLTLVMVSSIPAIVFSGAMMGIVLAKATNRGQKAYSAAASIVDQTIGSIRTVCVFAE